MPLLADLSLLMPELALAVGAMAVLIFGLFVKDPRYSLFACALVLLGGMIALYLQPQMAGIFVFAGALKLSLFTQGLKFLLLATTIIVLALVARALPRHHLDRPEFPVLIVLATLGMCIMISANSWLSLYLGLELQSLSLYVITAFARENAKAGEAGAKYFILGALASGFILFGMSFIFGATGGLTYNLPVAYPQGFSVGMAFILAGIAFKLSMVPFHMWTPDVYDGAPMPVTAYFAMAPKIAALGALATLMTGPFYPFAQQAALILLGLGLFSLVWGSFAGLRQNNLKRLMAYSTIANVGTILLALASSPTWGITAAFNYLIIYIAMSGAVFAVLLGLTKHDEPIEKLSDLAGLSKTYPALAWCLAIVMFSLAGIPPLAGFFAKFMAFKALVMSQLAPIAIAGIAASVVAAAYYLRIIKIMFFDAPVEGETLVHDGCLARRAVLILTMAVITALVFFPDAFLGFVASLVATLLR